MKTFVLKRVELDARLVYSIQGKPQESSKFGPKTDDSIFQAYPDLRRRVSWTEVVKGDDLVEETLQEEEEYEEYLEDDEDNVLDEFHEMPSCRGVVEWLLCLFFDVLVLVVEVGMSFWLASSLYEQELVGSYRAIVTILVLPCVFNPMLWVSMHQSYRALSANPLVVLGATAIGFPSPLFM